MYPIEDQGQVIIDQSTWRLLEEKWGVFVYEEAIRQLARVFLGEPRFGVRRRPGVIHIDPTEYHRVEDTVRQHFTSDLRYVLRLRAQCEGDLAHVEAVCRSAEHQLGERNVDAGTVQSLFEGLIRVKAYMGFNWLVPRDDYVQLIGEVLEDLTLTPTECLLHLCTPDIVPHYTQLNLALWQLALVEARGLAPDVDGFIHEIGFAQGYPLSRGLLEQVEGVRSEVQRRVESHQRRPQAIQAELDEVTGRLTAARARRDSVASLLIAAAHRDPVLLNKTLTMIETCRLMADEEEQRHLVEMRAVRTLRDVAHGVGINLALADETELLDAFALTETCLPDANGTAQGRRIWA